jgi:hypothetical protein
LENSPIPSGKRKQGQMFKKKEERGKKKEDWGRKRENVK